MLYTWDQYKIIWKVSYNWVIKIKIQVRRNYLKAKKTGYLKKKIQEKPLRFPHLPKRVW